MNKYTENLDRIEFLITLACTGHCKHCSEGEHISQTEFINGDTAAKSVHEICAHYNITSIMTFGGEPLLYPEIVCKIHEAASEEKIPERQIITNGFFSKSSEEIKAVASQLAASGVNDILLSVDAFHQETIPLEAVKLFAEAIKREGVPIRTHPAWLVSPEAENPYNNRTNEILAEFGELGFVSSHGNVIFPDGNAIKYLSEYFDLSALPKNPYEDDPFDVRSICFSPNGNVLGGNVNKSDIMDIIHAYSPY